MSASYSLDRRVRELFEREFDEPAIGVCPAGWLLPGLLRLMAEHHDRPVNELRPMIRHLIEEHQFAGHAAIDLRQQDLNDQCIDALVRVLEQVRREAFRNGYWSSAPRREPPIPMFG